MPKILCFILNQCFGFLDNKQGPLFLSKKNKRLSPRTLQDVFQKASGSLDINKHLHAHLFRHSFASHLNDNEVDILVIKSLMGHSTTRSTEIYIHPSMQKVRQAMEKLPGVVFMNELIKKGGIIFSFQELHT